MRLPGTGKGVARLVEVSMVNVDMADHRNPAVGKEVDGLSHRLPAFQLHSRAAGFLHDPGGRSERLLGRGLVAAERHVDRDERMPAAPDDRRAVRAHHVHGDRNR